MDISIQSELRPDWRTCGKITKKILYQDFMYIMTSLRHNYTTRYQIFSYHQYFKMYLDDILNPC
jgi:hypothetical protein